MSSIFDDSEFAELVDYFKQIDDEHPSYTSFLDYSMDSPDFDHPVLGFSMRDDLVGNLIQNIKLTPQQKSGVQKIF